MLFCVRSVLSLHIAAKVFYIGNFNSVCKHDTLEIRFNGDVIFSARLLMISCIHKADLFFFFSSPLPFILSLFWSTFCAIHSSIIFLILSFFFFFFFLIKCSMLLFFFLGEGKKHRSLICSGKNNNLKKNLFFITYEIF